MGQVEHIRTTQLPNGVAATIVGHIDHMWQNMEIAVAHMTVAMDSIGQPVVMAPMEDDPPRDDEGEGATQRAPKRRCNTSCVVWCSGYPTDNVQQNCVVRPLMCLEIPAPFLVSVA